jgi:hypothetical protein
MITTTSFCPVEVSQLMKSLPVLAPIGKPSPTSIKEFEYVQALTKSSLPLCK